MSGTTLTGVNPSYYFQYDNVTITNLGTVDDAAFGIHSDGTLTGETVINAGSIIGTTYGVDLGDGDAVTNLSTGAISGGIHIAGATGTVDNAGSVAGTVYGVLLSAGGTVTNESGGTISGGTDAVKFVGAGLLAIDPDAVFGGVVLGGGAGVLELASGADVGTLTGLGSAYSGFTSVTVDSGAVWQLNADMIGTGYTISDAGTLTNTGSIGSGVTLAGGMLTNAAGATISASGVAVSGQGTLENAGSISGGTDAVLFGTLTANRLIIDPDATFNGTIDGGNTLDAGHVSTLELASGASAGTLAGLGSTVVNFAKIIIDNGATWTLTADTIGNGYAITDSGTLTNQGSIGPTVTLTDAAVLTNASGATITGFGSYGSDAVYSGATATLVNAGSILDTSANSDGVVLLHGAVTNLTGGIIAGYAIGVASSDATITNTGSISATGPDSRGIVLTSAGLVTNQSGGVVSGYDGIAFESSNGGVVANAGRIIGDTASGSGVVLFSGNVTNQSGGTISGGTGVTGSDDDTVVNAGVLAGYAASGTGVYLGGGGSVTNQSGGLISGNAGIVLQRGGLAINLAGGTISGTTVGFSSGAGVTLVNAGVITATCGTYAVSFASGFTDLLTIDPGAVFGGTVSGGNAIGASAVSTLGLGSDASTGTLAGLGTQYLDFGQIVVDAGASWTLTNTATIASGMVLINNGTIASPVTLAAGTALTNASGGTVTGGGSTTAVSFGAGQANLLVIGPGAAFGGTVDGGNTIGSTVASTLELAAGGAAGTLGGLNAQYINFAQVAVDAGATWTLSAGGPLVANQTLTNAGTVATGVSLDAGAVLANVAGGLVTASGGAAVYAAMGGPVYVGNAGSIASGTGNGIYLSSGGSVTNQSGAAIVSGQNAAIFAQYGATATVVNAGTVSGYTDGIDLGGGGSVTNLATGYITGQGEGIVGASLVVNYGSISSPVLAIDSIAGSLTNQSSGVIQGFVNVAAVVNAGSINGEVKVRGLLSNLGSGVISGSVGAYLEGFNDTLINAGTIIGTGGTAVSMSAGSGRRVIIDPGAVFSGFVNGGNTLGAANVSTLELASSASIGTLTGLGSQYLDFANIVVDAGAQWVLASDTIGSGYTITDNGTLTTQGSLGSPVTLGTGAMLVNTSGGTISATGTAVSGTGTVVNAGSISGGTDAVSFGAGYANRLVVDSGAVFSGTVNGGNTIGSTIASTLELGSYGSTGTLSGLNTQFTDFTQITVDAGAYWIFNADSPIGAGQTLGNSGSIFSTVSLQPGAVLTNAAGGLITASGAAAVLGLSGGAASLVNAGSIVDATGNAISLRSGGSVTNQYGGLITGHIGISGFLFGAAATVVNYGSIGGSSIGIYLTSGGAVTNLATGVISSAGTGIVDANLVVNYGSIVGTSFSVDSLSASLTNETSGVILGTALVRTLVNAGTIYGGAHEAAYVDGSQSANVSLTNLTTGTISGSVGVGAAGGTATVINAGTIIGTGGTAVSFAAGSGRRMVIDPNAVFSGEADGGNTIGAANVSTLGLASGASIGTLTGLGSQYIHFANIVVDAGAQWVLASDTIGGGYTITDNGTLTNTGSLGSPVTLGSGAVLTNSVSGTIASSGVAISGAGTLTNAGSISGATDAVLFSTGYANRLVVDPGAAFGGTVDGGNTFGSTVISTLELASGTFTGTLTGLGTQLIDFAQVTLDANAAWTLDTTLAGGSTLNIAAGATIVGSGIAALRGPSSGSVTVVNAGLIDPATNGVYLPDGGTVTNLAGGLIEGTTNGVLINGAAGTVTNAGSISGGTNAVSLAAGYANRLVVDPGAAFSGTVDGGNTISSTIASTLELASTGSTGTLAGLNAQYINFAQITVDAGAYWTFNADSPIGANETLTNAGTIGSALSLAAGALLTNVTGGLIEGGNPSAVIGLAGGTATVVNAGTISGGVFLNAGGSVINQTGGTISGGRGIYAANTAAAVVNAGSIIGGRYSGYVVDLASGGSFTNQTSGVISGFHAVYLQNDGTVVNDGSITGGADGVLGSFSLTNQSSGVITGSDGVNVEGSGGTVVNAGSIGGTTAGVKLFVGTVSNQASGIISGSGVGILGTASFFTNNGTTYAYGGAGTVVNAGTIIGSGGTAVSLVAHFANRVVVDPDAVFTGKVNGGNTLGATVVSTLELASSASTGTLTGLGTQYINFGDVEVDTGATWAVTGSATGIVNNAGTLTVNSGLYFHAATLTNSGSITGELYVANAILTNSGVISGVSATNAAVLASEETVVNSGTITNVASINGIDLFNASSLTNASGGLIQGYIGIYGSRFAGTIINYGTIAGIGPGGRAAGIQLRGRSTLINAGTISSDYGDAVLLGTGYANRLVIDPQAAFSGTVDGGNTIGSTIVSTLELASGASTGTLSGLGTQFINFAQLTIDANAVWNLSSALVSGSTLNIAAGATIVGSGTAALRGASNGGVTVVNAGLIDPATYGVYLPDGGTVTNVTGGMIEGTTDGVLIKGAAGTVLNAGSISGGTDVVSFAAGYANRLVFSPGASFSGTVDGGNTIGSTIASTLELASGASTGTLSGLGTQFIDFAQIAVDANALWKLNTTLASGSTLNIATGATIVGSGTAAVRGASNGSVTVVNAGLIDPATYGVYLPHGGSVTNLAGAVIDGTTDGVLIKGAAGTVTNAGSISGSTNAVLLAAGYANRLVFAPGATFSGTVDGGNTLGSTVVSTLELASGASTATLSGLGTQFVDFAQLSVDANASWKLTNTLVGGSTLNIAAGGTIVGNGAAAVRGASSGGVTVVNAGLIGPATNGVYLPDGGTVTNLAGGVIEGTTNGVLIKGAAGTVTNAGSISGGANPVSFAAGYANRLVIDPGAAFSGTINGGNTLGSTIASTLELGSTGSTGTLAGLNAQYVDFAQIAVDAGAQWNLSADSPIGAYQTLTNAGTIGSAVSLAAGAVLTNVAGGLIAPSATTAVIGLTGGAVTIVNAGSIAGATYTLISGGGVGIDDGIVLNAGGSVINQAGGTISGERGIYATGGAATLVNAGRIAENTTSGTGVVFKDGGSITNQLGGVISGLQAVVVRYAAATVVNAGSLSAANYAVYISDGGSVTNLATGVISGSNGIVSRGGTTTVVNYGSITGTLSGVSINGSLTNHSSGVITGQAYATTIVNAGSIYGGTLRGALVDNGVLTNQTTGVITGAYGAYGRGSSSTIVNAGSIGGTTIGVDLFGGLVSNQAGGIVSSSGIGLLGAAYVSTNHGTTYTYGSAGTVVNAGTIIGSGGTAVSLAAQFANRVVVDPDAVFTGKVDGGNTIGATIVSTMELASAATAGTLSSLGTQFVDFAQTSIDSGAQWTLTGTNTLTSGTTLTNAGTLTLSNATFGDAGILLNNGVIVLDPSTMTVASLIGTGSVTLDAGTTLEVSGTIASTETIVFGGSGAMLKLDNPGSVAGTLASFTTLQTIDLGGVLPGSVHYAATGGGVLNFNFSAGGSGSIALPGGGPVNAVSDGDNGADVTAVCFLSGTQILTDRGEISVETLVPGDRVITLSGKAEPIVWIGTGRVRITPARRNAATPVIVRKSALADNVPNRDLYVTKGHSFLLDNVLIPAEFLVNHRSIHWDDRIGHVVFYHIELAQHDVLFANCAAAESYRDDGNRWLFNNANSAWDQPPKLPYAPVLTGGPVVDAVWRRLLNRAGPRPGQPLTDDPDLHLLVDGARVDAVRRRNGVHVFQLECCPASVRVVSRAAAPAELGLARDPRSLGVAVHRVVLWQGARVRVIEAMDASLADGFHGYEADNGIRWTNGYARLPLPADVTGPYEMELHIGGTTRYVLDEPTTLRAAA